MNPSLYQMVSIGGEGDIVAARRAVREAAQAVGFGLTDTTRIVTAASELARNICKYAGAGVMHVRHVERDDRAGLELDFVDKGPGIEDLEKAMEEGFSTSGGLGLGLPGSKRLMDEMDVRSTAGRGTTVSVRKWLRS